MEFRLLGGLEIAVGTRLLALGGRRQQAMVAALLLRANLEVGAYELAEFVWDEPPESYVESLRNFRHRLRKVLCDETGRQRLLTGARGVRLVVEPGEFDRESFGQSLGLGDTALAADDLPAAKHHYSAALDLWRMSAAPPLPTRKLQAVVTGLIEKRELAAGRLARVRIDLGEHASVLGELHEKVVAQPLREDLAGLFMLALYQSGRQDEALQHFRDTRERLVNELGVEPGQQLRQLHQQLLDDGVSLAAEPQLARPAALPQRMPGFAGREQALSQLDAALAGWPVVLVTGAAGVGKTTLAIHWAHRVRNRFPDGQLHANLRGFDPAGQPVSPGEALRGFLEALQVPTKRIPSTVEAQAALYRSLLADRRVLVVLDNARDAEQIRPLLPGTPGCMVVVTSRYQLAGLVAGEGAQPLTLDLLSSAEARQLLVCRLGHARVDAEPDAVAEIIAGCARLPLALSIVAARAATHPGFPLSRFASELRGCDGRLDAFEGSDAATDLRRVLSWSYHQLTPQAARVFRMLGLHPGPDVTAPAAASLAGVPPSEMRSLLAELAQAHLIVEHLPGRYTSHDLLRAYAAELTATEDSQPDQHEALHRIFEHYLHTASSARRQLVPHRPALTAAAPRPDVWPEQIEGEHLAMDWYSAELPVLLGLIQRSAHFDADGAMWNLIKGISEYLNRRGLWRERLATHQIGLNVARQHADIPGQAYCHRVIGLASARLGRSDDARTHLAEALSLYQRLGDHLGQASAHQDFSVLHKRQGDYDAAIGHDQLALEFSRLADDRAGQARALNDLGWINAKIGHYRLAARYCRQAVEMSREAGDRRGEAAALDSLGVAYLQLGEHSEAVAYFTQSADLNIALGDMYGQARNFTNLGDAYAEAGQDTAASGKWQQALIILTDLDHPDAEDVRKRLEQQSSSSPG